MALDQLPSDREEIMPLRPVNGMDYRSHSGYAYGIRRNSRGIPVGRMFNALGFRPLLRKSLPH